MNKTCRGALPFLILLFCAILIAGAFGQTSTVTVGVSTGEFFKYNLTYFWASSNQADSVPASLLQKNATDFFQIDVLSVGGRSVGLQETWSFLDGTRTIQTIIEAVGNATSDSFIFVYSANINVGNPLFPAESDLPYRVNQTVSRSYNGVARETNHVAITRTDVQNETFTSIDIYFDKQTGVLVEGTLIDIYSATPNQTFTTHIALKESSVWEVSSLSPTPTSTSSTGTQPPTNTDTGSTHLIILLIAIVTVVGVIASVILTHTKKAPKSNPSEPKRAQQTPATVPGHCSNCGYDNPPTNEFCGKCGKRLKE
jgi:hypothetical protein